MVVYETKNNFSKGIEKVLLTWGKSEPKNIHLKFVKFHLNSKSLYFKFENF